jgi:hypothetical protein
MQKIVAKRAIARDVTRDGAMSDVGSVASSDDNAFFFALFANFYRVIDHNHMGGDGSKPSEATPFPTSPAKETPPPPTTMSEPAASAPEAKEYPEFPGELMSKRYVVRWHGIFYGTHTSCHCELW